MNKIRDQITYKGWYAIKQLNQTIHLKIDQVSHPHILLVTEGLGKYIQLFKKYIFKMEKEWFKKKNCEWNFPKYLL